MPSSTPSPHPTFAVTLPTCLTWTLVSLLSACGGSGSGEPTAQELSPAQRPLALTATSPVNRYDFSSGALTLPGLHVVLADASNTVQTSCYDASLRTQSAEPLVLELVGAPSTPCTSSATALGNYIGATGLLTLPGMTAARSTGSSCYDVVMRKTSDNPIRLALVSALSATCAGDVTLAGTSSTAGVACGLSRSAYNADPSVLASSNASWTCGSARVLTANGIPDHAVGSFPNANNPNAITAQAVSASYSLTPVITNPSGSASMVAGHALNGVKFDPGTAGTCSDAGNCSAIGGGGAWNLEAINSGFKFGTDSSNAHVQPNGQYHYHGMPEGLLDRLGKGAAMTLVGWAVDGFPVYARYGYADASNARSAIKVLASSYQLKTSPDAGRPSTTLWKMGTFTQDYRYAAGSGDLDECNGRSGATPEFPNGIYHYVVTDSYPFIQRCVKGAAAAGGPPPR